MRVRANVSLDIAPVLATVTADHVHDAPGWIVVRLDQTSDSHPMLMTEYVTMPANRCDPA
jgi:hypothetical protein